MKLPQVKPQPLSLGHSFGGHAFGLLPNHYKNFRGMYVFATGAGWRGWMTRRESMRANLLWNAILPALTFFKGYTPRCQCWEWVKICLMGSISSGDNGANIRIIFLMTQFVSEKCKKICPNKGALLWRQTRWMICGHCQNLRDAFMQGYTNADLTLLDIPLTASLPKIGHMGYFRASAQPLWGKCLIMD